MDSTKLLVVGGNGGAWVGSSFDLVGIKKTERILDPFHVKRTIKRSFRNVLDTRQVISNLYQFGFEAVRDELEYAVNNSRGKDKDNRAKCLKYLEKHADEILPLPQRDIQYCNLGSLGAMESNISKVVAHRMKTRGCSWTIDGAIAMLAILRHKAELTEHAFHYEAIRKTAAKQKTLQRKKVEPEIGTIPHGTFPILDNGKMSTPYAKMFKAIINAGILLS